MHREDYPVCGAGLGLRRELMGELCRTKPRWIDFLELAPENWISVGGHRRNALDLLVGEYPIICHGLSLSLGGPRPLDTLLIEQIKCFVKEHAICYYSEHLSYCGDTQGQLYELFPIPFTEEAVYYVARRIKQVQECLEQRIAVENISYYCPLATALTERELILIKIILYTEFISIFDVYRNCRRDW